MRWSFSFSFWVINGLYDSDYNSSLYAKPEVIEIDECGPDNLLSAGFALWLVLVPAVACVVQLPGSIFLFNRSNFYRFSPELGIVDSLAVLILFAKALWNGYRWNESIAAALTVRAGIGQGHLWWREDLRELSGSSTATTDEVASTNPARDANGQQGSEETENQYNPPRTPDGTADDRLHDLLSTKFAPVLSPISQEQVIGAGLFAVAFTKIIAMLVALPDSGIRLSCFLALAYSASYLVLELMTWALASPSSRNSLKNVPFENLLEVVKLVDPGDNPFTFPARGLTDGSPPALEMHTFASNDPSGSPQGIAATGTVDSRVPWNRLIAAVVASLGIVGPLFWMLILSHIWSPTRGALILTNTAIAFAVLRTTGKWLYRKFRQQLHVSNSNLPARQASEHQASVEETSLPSVPTFVQYNSHGILVFFLVWTWRRITVVNLYSAIWIVVICYYFAKIVPERLKISSGESTGMTPRKPGWLDWLG